MKIHHEHHRKVYIKLTKLYNKEKGLFPPIKGKFTRLEDLCKNYEGKLALLAGEVYSHNLFFNCLSPQGGDQMFKRVGCKDRLRSEYDTFEGLKQEFEKVALKFDSGSGFIYLQANKDKSYARLEVVGFKPGETPFMRGHYPLLCIDFWEHAYLDNKLWRSGDEGKKAYIRSWFNCINWEYVNKMYDRAFPRFPMFGGF